MERLYFLLILFLFIFSPLFAKTTDIELIKKEISETQEISEAEKIRQVATLYRLEGNYEKSFKELKKSLEKGLINDLMLEDLAGLAHWLHKEKELKTIASSLFSQKPYKDKLSGLLLKSLLDINKNPEEVLTNLRKFSIEHTSENLNPLFILLVKRAYSQLGNWERVNYFSHLFQNQFSHYYQPSFSSEKKEIDNKKKQLKPSELSLVQVGSFTSEGHYLLSFLNKLKKLNLKPILEKKEKITQIKIETTNLKKLIETLEKEKIDYFILQSTYPSQEEQEKMAKISWKKEDSIIQVGSFKIYEKAQNFRNMLIKDSFVTTEILYQPQEKLFSVYLKTKNPTELIQKLKTKGYKAFVKYPSKKI